jgi:Radical SAM superfamily
MRPRGLVNDGIVCDVAGVIHMSVEIRDQANIAVNESRILVIRPPQILSYFNAGHHLALYQVAGHLRRKYPAGAVDVLDASVVRTTWRDIAEIIFSSGYRYIVVMNDLDSVDGIARFLHYVSSLSPLTKTVTFGRLSSMRPELFARYRFDAVVTSGDYETGVAAALEAMHTGSTRAAGARLRSGDSWIEPQMPGATLDPSEWILPGVDEIPYDRYDELYGDETRKFSGLPSKRELVVPVARGCPVGCSFCEVPTVFGKRERRLPVSSTLTYIRDSFAAAPFDYVSFYAPTFTLDREWVDSLCRELRVAPVPWKCCTTMHHLDERLVRNMGASGCVRISVGVETLEESAYPNLPRAKRKQEGDLRRLAGVCAASGVELNCFIIVGLPGTSPEGTRGTIELLEALGARVRPTVFTPYDLLSGESTDAEIMAMNRQLFVPHTTDLDAGNRQVAYSLLYGRHALNPSRD